MARQSDIDNALRLARAVGSRGKYAVGGSPDDYYSMWRRIVEGGGAGLTQDQIAQVYDQITGATPVTIGPVETATSPTSVGQPSTSPAPSQPSTIEVTDLPAPAPAPAPAPSVAPSTPSTQSQPGFTPANPAQPMTMPSAVAGRANTISPTPQTPAPVAPTPAAPQAVVGAFPSVIGARAAAAAARAAQAQSAQQAAQAAAQAYDTSTSSSGTAGKVTDRALDPTGQPAVGRGTINQPSVMPGATPNAPLQIQEQNLSPTQISQQVPGMPVGPVGPYSRADVNALAAMMFGEANTEGAAGMAAAGWAAVNRAISNYNNYTKPNSPLSPLQQQIARPGQFLGYNQKSINAMNSKDPATRAAAERAQAMAEGILSGQIPNPIGNRTDFNQAGPKGKQAPMQIGSHSFFEDKTAAGRLQQLQDMANKAKAKAQQEQSQSGPGGGTSGTGGGGAFGGAGGSGGQGTGVGQGQGQQISAGPQGGAGTGPSPGTGETETDTSTGPSSISGVGGPSGTGQSGPGSPGTAGQPGPGAETGPGPVGAPSPAPGPQGPEVQADQPSSLSPEVGPAPATPSMPGQTAPTTEEPAAPETPSVTPDVNAPTAVQTNPTALDPSQTYDPDNPDMPGTVAPDPEAPETPSVTPALTEYVASIDPADLAALGAQPTSFEPGNIAAPEAPSAPEAPEAPGAEPSDAPGAEPGASPGASPGAEAAAAEAAESAAAAEAASAADTGSTGADSSGAADAGGLGGLGGDAGGGETAGGGWGGGAGGDGGDAGGLGGDAGGLGGDAGGWGGDAGGGDTGGGGWGGGAGGDGEKRGGRIYNNDHVKKALRVTREDGGQVPPQFYGDSQTLREYLKMLGQKEYRTGVGSMTPDEHQAWLDLTEMYNFPRTVGPYATLEDEKSDMLQYLNEPSRRNMSDRYLEESYADGGPIVERALMLTSRKVS